MPKRNRRNPRRLERQAQNIRQPEALPQATGAAAPSLAQQTAQVLVEAEKVFPGPFEPDLRSMAAAAPLMPATPRFATAAQIAANQANAQLSTGPVSAAGKATVSQNRLAHGLAGRFQRLPEENPEDLRLLTESIYAEFKPADDTEKRLADSVIQHYWRMQRAIRLQDELLVEHIPATDVDNKRLTLFMRYQSTHERSYYKAVRELQNIKKQKHKDEIGFESQKRQQESHAAAIRLANAKATSLELGAQCRQTIEASLPGLAKIPPSAVLTACNSVIDTEVQAEQLKTAA